MEKIDEKYIELLKLKAEIRSHYPDGKVDLTQIKEINVAKQARFLAEQGLNANFLARAIDIEIENIRSGMDIFTRMAYWNSYLDAAPSWFFRPGFKRRKTIEPLFPQEKISQ